MDRARYDAARSMDACVGAAVKMDAHQTRGTRSIPIVIVYDEPCSELGWWGPRPTELQDRFYDEGKALEKTARYKHLRSWYARDRGRTTLQEVPALIDRAASGIAAPSTSGGLPG